ncbi:uncharacterized protein LOC127748874 [Frankliniella occidentalis]|uniref:Uncharacterized protein LOC127748874 n=1 Tax=Frankliniella occidentalis TaxID=133901 RepID=A0A9C6U357_FRAOC|nr:uncharacterized protein LOC127748874 [Frankliniella occidentalis]
MLSVAVNVLAPMWRFERLLGAVLGVLPVSGDWPPRPWPFVWAYLAASLSVGLYVVAKVWDHVLTRASSVSMGTSTMSSNYTTFTVLVIAVRMLVERLSCAHMRIAYSDLAESIALYSRRHPLSRDAWRDLLHSGLLGTLWPVCSLGSYVVFVGARGARSITEVLFTSFNNFFDVYSS